MNCTGKYSTPCRAAALALVLCAMAVGALAEDAPAYRSLFDLFATNAPMGEAPQASTSPQPVPTPDPQAPLSDYYEHVIKPQMDSIGNNMRHLFESKDELEAAFKTAKQAVDTLEAACAQVPEFAQAEELMGYLSAMKDDIGEGLKRSESVPTTDATIMEYQQRIANTLKAFKDCIDKLL